MSTSGQNLRLGLLAWLRHGRFLPYADYQSQGLTMAGFYPSSHWHDPSIYMVNGQNVSDDTDSDDEDLPPLEPLPE